MSEKSIGEVIKNARKSKGMTQKELADIIGVTNATVQKYEKGAIKNIPISSLVAIMECLNISPKELGIKSIDADNSHLKQIAINNLNELFGNENSKATIIGPYYVIDLPKFTDDEIEKIIGTVSFMVQKRMIDNYIQSAFKKIKKGTNATD